MKILFVTSGVLPVPSEKGGAVETLADALAYQNEQADTENMEFVFLSVFDREAELKIQKLNYHKSRYKFIRIPEWILNVDRFFYKILNDYLKISSAKRFRFMIQRLHFIRCCRRYLCSDKSFDWIVIENNTLLLHAVKGTVYRHGKTIYYAHNDIGRGLLNKNKLADCSKIITVSDYLQKNIRRILEQNQRNTGKKIHIPEFITVKNGINTDIFKPYTDEVSNQYRNQYGFSRRDYIFIFVGRLVPEKGIEQVISAFNCISGKYERAKLLIVGSNSFGLNVNTKFEKKIIKMAEKNRQNIVFTGFIENKALPYFYNMADAAILPSLWEEPAGLTMVEAVSCGLPLITTNSGGISEYIPDGYSVMIKKPYLNLEQQLETEMNVLMGSNIKREEIIYKAECYSKGYSYKHYYKAFLRAIRK